ncbi:MAG: hypothetical protein LBF67_04405, partial [Prevotellaceae bacterium]|nr:hypothetical protein [Prevotellaceae bacterium]
NNTTDSLGRIYIICLNPGLPNKGFLLYLPKVVFFLCYDNKITTFGRPAMAALFITEFLVGQ